ncbi:dienelactone hydrolase family protein [Nocardioides sp.]|uniref:dienelactone hydrolase family protein n=1 Tax=Nocardioides sp. TaxID=35761 RepID=UPI0025F8F83E|nr:dienelactone hydrolase family protein [Nocardioides sp.]
MSYAVTDDELADFELRRVELGGLTREVYVTGDHGPAVVVMPEMPGISPELARFARWVRDAGFVVHVPSLFGRPGVVGTAEEGAEVMRRACVSAEFRVLAGGGTSPVVGWLRALAASAHAECGGPGVGIVGMCFTGNFALAAALEPAVLAPVLSQPSLPLDDPSGLELSDPDAAALRDRFERDDLVALGLRFEDDRWCRRERFDAYRALLGDRFRAVMLPAGSANPEPPPFHRDVVASPHSVLTVHLVDEVGHPTTAARDAVLGFLCERLGVAAS